MKKRLLWRILIIIGGLILIRLAISKSYIVYWKNLVECFFALLDFEFKFSFSRFLNLISFSALFYFIYYSHRVSKDSVNTEMLSIWRRYRNTIEDHESIILRVSFILLPLLVCLFAVIGWWNFPQSPELFIPFIVFLIIECIDFSRKTFENRHAENSYLFTDEPIEEYSQLNEFQQVEVKILKRLVEVSGPEYLSIAINGKWGSGKTTILKGLKSLIKKDCIDENINSGRVEFIEINLWQVRTPENAIIELERLFKEIFNKVYLTVSSQHLAFFSALAGLFGSNSSEISSWLGANDSITVSRDNLNEKLDRVLSHLDKNKLVILIDDLDRISEEHLNGFLKVICYVTGLKNVVAISGINREKILLKLGKLDEIKFKADGISAYDKSKNKQKERESISSGIPNNQEKKSKEEIKFSKFESESFLSKIFSIQRDIINSDYYVKNIEVNYKGFEETILYEDKKDIIKGIIEFLDKNHKYFNTYREKKLFLNEVFVYLIGFAGNKQDEIKLSDYISIESLLAMAWAKVIYPDFYNEIQNYVIPFFPQEINIIQKSAPLFELNNYIQSLHSFNDDGSYKTVNTQAHQQIKFIFSQLEGNMSIYKLSVAVKYFKPIIEPYEFTNKEFTKNFVDGKTTVEGIKNFIEPKWKLNPQYVLHDFLRRVRSRDFYPTDRLNSAVILMDAIVKTKKSEEYNIYEEEIDLWVKVITLFENILPLSVIQGQERLRKYDNFKYIFSTSFELFLDLWEKKYFLVEDNDLTGAGAVNFKNPFYRFFNVSDFPDDKINETKKNYEILLDSVSTHKFENPENKVHCLMFIYKLSAKFWEGDNRRMFERFDFSEILPFFLESLYQMPETDCLQEIYPFQDFIIDCVRSKCDDILFDLTYIEKLIVLLKNNAFFYAAFLDELKNRNEGCTLSEDKRKLVYETLKKELDIDPNFFDTGYDTVIREFFKIDEVFP